MPLAPPRPRDNRTKPPPYPEPPSPVVIFARKRRLWLAAVAGMADGRAKEDDPFHFGLPPRGRREGPTGGDPDASRRACRAMWREWRRIKGGAGA